MKKSKILTFSKCLLVFAFSVNGQSEETSTYDRLWSKVSLYENEQNPLIRKFSLTGRLQGDYHSFENDETGESATDLEVDQLHKDNNKFCQLLVEKDPSMASSVFEVLFISKSLERVCDHAVNISKEIFFIATSRDVRHAPEYKKAALRRDLK